jgi:hypothetical protein
MLIGAVFGGVAGYCYTHNKYFNCAMTNPSVVVTQTLTGYAVLTASVLLGGTTGLFCGLLLNLRNSV